MQQATSRGGHVVSTGSTTRSTRAVVSTSSTTPVTGRRGLDGLDHPGDLTSGAVPAVDLLVMGQALRGGVGNLIRGEWVARLAVCHRSGEEPPEHPSCRGQQRAT